MHANELVVCLAFKMSKMGLHSFCSQNNVFDLLHTFITVLATSVATKPNLCTKKPIFNKLVLTAKVPPHPSLQSSILALTGALK